jgi:AraC-like DNA-binding protein
MDRERRFKKYVLVASEATKAYIEENPLVDKTTSQFAEDVNINRKQLQAAFKELTGMGIQEYQLTQRMKKARQLLQAGNLPIKEIAITCRYKSQRAFTTAFKKTFGITPMEYQNQHSY